MLDYLNRKIRNLMANAMPLRSKTINLEIPIFIWGAPRSGTTLLYQLMAQHPDVGYVKHTNTQLPREGTELWWKVFGEHRGSIDPSLATSQRIDQLTKAYSQILQSQNKSRLLDKNPFMTLWIPVVDRIFPKAKHIHIIRDGRAVVNSMVYIVRDSKEDRLRRFREGKDMFGPQPPDIPDPMALLPIERHIQQWLLLVEQGRDCAEFLGERYIEVRYEDLVDQPQKLLRILFKHAQLDYDEAFILENFPEKFTNQNYKWQTDEEPTQPFNGIHVQRAIYKDDLPYFKPMEPLLRDLGYICDDKQQA